MLHSQYSSVSDCSQDSVFGRTQSIDGSFMVKSAVKQSKINPVFQTYQPKVIFDKSTDEGFSYVKNNIVPKLRF